MIPNWWQEAISDQRVQTFWILGLTALLLHGILDPFTTYVAVNVLEAGSETNPLVAWYLQYGPISFVAFHLPLYAVVVGILGAFTWLFWTGSASEKVHLYRLSLIAWTIIILWGMVIVGNNLLVLI